MVWTKVEKKVFDAATRGNLKRLEAVARKDFKRGGNVLNALDDEKHTLLHDAALFGHEHIVEWLLSDKGGRALGFTKVLAKGNIGYTAVHSAALKRHFSCWRVIAAGCKMENGEREEMMNSAMVQGSTMLHYAVGLCDLNAIRWLLSHEEGGGRAFGFKSETIMALGWDSRSVLHDIATDGSVECLEALLSGCTAGERIRLFLTVDERGWTVLHYAVGRSNIPVLQELLRREETKMILEARDHQGMTALHRLACNGGLDKESRREWEMRMRSNSHLIEPVVRMLIGLDPTTTATAVGFMDVNAGLEIPEEIKEAAAAAAEEEAKKRAAPKEQRKAKQARV